MRQAAVPGYRLSRSKKSTKILTSLGLIGLLLGLLSAALLTIAKTGLSADAVISYYLGSAPSDDLGGMLSASVARPFAELAEVTHLHLAGGSMLLFFLCHLLSLCQISETFRISCYIVSFFSFILSFSLPWLIIYVAPWFAYLYGPSMCTFVISLVVLAIIPLREIWFSPESGDNE